MKKQRVKTDYLYGLTPADFAYLPYADALLFKLEAAKSLLAKLVTHNLKDRDLKRVADVYNAIQFNRDLLEELEGAK